MTTQYEEFYVHYKIKYAKQKERICSKGHKAVKGHVNLQIYYWSPHGQSVIMCTSSGIHLLLECYQNVRAPMPYAVQCERQNPLVS